jgi:hypothetical protein
VLSPPPKQDCTYSHFEHSSSCPTCRKQLGENDFIELVVADNYEALTNENAWLKQKQTSLRLQYEQKFNDMQNKLLANDIDGSATDGNRTDGNRTNGNGIDGSVTDGNVNDGNVNDGNSNDGNGTAVDSANLHNKTNVGKRKRTRGGRRHNKNKGSDGG